MAVKTIVVVLQIIHTNFTCATDEELYEKENSSIKSSFLNHAYNSMLNIHQNMDLQI